MVHIIAAFITHVMMTAWTIFQVLETMSFHDGFLSITMHGACNGINLLPNYWEAREQIELVQVALNAIALIISALLSWKLVRVSSSVVRVQAKVRLLTCDLIQNSLH
jgi:hypothetical protein